MRQIPPRSQSRTGYIWLSAAWVGALALFILAGCWLVPLHGDEPTVIYMSLDADVLRRLDFAALYYREPPSATDPQAATRQDLRLINGVISKYWYGALWIAAGMRPTDINDQWLWGADLAFNRANGHVPSDSLLFLTRWGSGLLTALSAAFVFVIGRRIGGWPVAIAASLIFTLTPAVLLNGRRAMMESALLAATGFLTLAGLALADRLRRSARSPRPPRGMWIGAVVFGLAAGLTVAAKHTGALLVGAVSAGVLAAALVQGRAQALIRAALALALAGAVAAVVFVTLNPAWWPAPLTMPGRVLSARSALLEGQVRAFGGYTSLGDQARGFIEAIAAAPPQYYEVSQGWPEWIGPQITAYASGAGGLLAGLSGPLASAAIGALLLIGGGRMVWRARHARRGALVTLLAATLLSAAAIFALTPLAWQRYYLPLAPFTAIVCGAAFLPPGGRPDAHP